MPNEKTKTAALQLHINKAKAIDAKIDKKTRESVLSAIEYFFEKEGKYIDAIGWYQYTPSFNDGDVCHFNMGEIGFKPTDLFTHLLKQGGLERDDVDGGESSAEIFEENDLWMHDSYVLRALTEAGKELPARLQEAINHLEKLWSIMCHSKKYMERTFKNNRQFLITKDNELTDREYYEE